MGPSDNRLPPLAEGSSIIWFPGNGKVSSSGDQSGTDVSFVGLSFVGLSLVCFSFGLPLLSMESYSIIYAITHK